MENITEKIKKNLNGLSPNNQKNELEKYYKSVLEITVEVDRLEYMNKGYSLADETIENLREEGWNTDYIDITRYCNNRFWSTLPIRFLVVKDKQKSSVEEFNFTERQLWILDNAFHEKEDFLDELETIKFHLDEHHYEESWINGQGNEPIEYLEEVSGVREILKTLTEDEGKSLYEILMKRQAQEVK